MIFFYIFEVARVISILLRNDFVVFLVLLNALVLIDQSVYVIINVVNRFMLSRIIYFKPF